MNVSYAEQFLKKIPSFNVAVIGDLILDNYIWGEASRISPEAPVPVVHVKHRTSALGGAANVINNIRSLGAKCTAYGVVGDDADGRKLRGFLDELGCDTQGMLTDSSRCTTVKTRVIASKQQVVRIDEEDVKPLSDELKKKLVEVVIADIDAGKVQGIIFEDYAKGVLDLDLVQKINDYARAHGLLTAMDPHPGQPMNLKGLTFITPNRMEAFALAGVYLSDGLLPLAADAPLMEVGKRLTDLWQSDMLLVTLGSHGMALFEDEKEVYHIPTKAKEVFDVSGAGDTVIATLMLGLLADAGSRQAAELANHAAGVVVGHVGTAPIKTQEFLDSFV